MGDFSNYEKQGPRAGVTVPYEVTELRNPDGTHPIVHVEHLGRSNTSLLEEMLADAGAPAIGASEALGKARGRIIRHSARKLENAFYSDGTLATDADLPKFIAAMPLKAFERLAAFAMSEAPFVEYPIGTDSKALAEK